MEAFQHPYISASQDPEADAEEIIPTIDISLLNKGTADQRSQTVQDLIEACKEWKIFMVVNHDVPENLRVALLAVAEEFFALTEEEKLEHTMEHVLDPIGYGTNFFSDVRRDYFKALMHPELHYPAKPTGFREILQEYASYTRRIARELLEGIWEGLELDGNSIDNTLGLDSCYQLFVVNLYHPCTHPADPLSFALPAHTDYGLLTMLFENGINGLQVERSGRWVDVKPIPNSLVVNVGDHLEIVSNGRLKGAMHRVRDNSQSKRVSIATAIGPSMETIVVPAPQLVCEGCPAGYAGMKYEDYIQEKLLGKLVLKDIKMPIE